MPLRQGGEKAGPAVKLPRSETECVPDVSVSQARRPLHVGGIVPGQNAAAVVPPTGFEPALPP
jgi:hypothetical protein